MSELKMAKKDKENQEKEGAPVMSSDMQKHFFQSRSVMIFGEVDMDLACKISSQILALSQASSDPIRVFVNSPGGHVESGYTIYDMLKFVKCPIHMVGTGWVASIASIIYLATPKKFRFVLPNTRFLLHQPHGGMQGTAQDVKIQAEEIIKTREHINRMISEETGVDMTKVSQHTDRDYWLSAEEALKYGLVGSIISSIDDLPK
jgi:ATP-dependent Clp protease, protease subunit